MSRVAFRQIGLSIYWAVAFAALIVSSYRLWLPAQWTSAAAYPAVPLFDWLTPFEFWLDRAWLPMMAAAIVMVLSGRTRFVRLGWAAVSFILLLAIGVDQHRLQPWAYQTALYGLVFSIAWNAGPLPLIRALAISVYFFSAVGKLDFQFLHTVGQDFLVTAGSAFGLDATQWPVEVRLWAAACFPATEALIAALLIFPGSRRVGGALVVIMHVVLIGLLSPWGLGHSPGVLTWNAVLAGQAVWLFLLPAEGQSDTQPNRSGVVDAPADESEEICDASDQSLHRLSRRRPADFYLAALIVTAACLLPWGERRGWWDHWPSWALYAPHSSRFNLQVHASHRRRLPDLLRQSVQPDQDDDRWHDVDLGHWSLKARGVPVLPQARYQLGLAIRLAKVAERSTAGDATPLAIRGILQSASDRWTGRRKEQWFASAAEMKQATDQFWLLGTTDQ